MKKEVLMSLVLLTFVTLGAAFAQSPMLDKLTFNGVEVRAANKQISGAVVIPATAPDGRAVTRIAGFFDCVGITSVTIPASVALISNSSFQNCTNLNSVTFQGQATLQDNYIFPGDLAVKYKAGGAGTYTRQAGGPVWTKQAAAIAPNTSLNGDWRNTGALNNSIITISGNTAVFSYFFTQTPLYSSAKDKGYYKEGVQFFRNLRSTGNLKWSGQMLGITSNTRSPDVATGTGWADITITMNPEGNTLTDSAGGTWISADIQ